MYQTDIRPRKKYQSLVSYGEKKSSATTFPLYLPSLVPCHLSNMKGCLWCLHLYWWKAGVWTSGLLDDKGTLRGEVINDTANNTSQKPVRQKSIQIQVSWPCCNSMYFEKAAKELTLSLWAVLAIQTGRQQELGQAGIYCIMAKASDAREQKKPLDC